MTSYQALINKIEAFYNDHLQVKKVGSDFNEQLPNFATKDERYPLVFITPIVASTTMDVNTISLEVYCLDIIQKDRANITVILSDCHQILVDLINYFNFSNDYSFDIVGSPSITPLNNQLLDYAAGWVMTLDVDISNWTNCQVPLKLPVVVGCDTISVTYTLVGEEPVTVEVEKEVDLYDGKNYYLLPIIEFEIVLFWSLPNLKWLLSIGGETYLTEDTPCPFGVYTIEPGSIFEAFSVAPVTN